MQLKKLLISLAALGLTTPAHAVQNGLGAKPYQGWSSWSLEATKYPGYGGMDWLTAEHLKAQSDILHEKLQAHGYNYLNMDSGWQGSYDEFGRPIPNAKKFPLGILDMAQYVHARGQKLGIYWIPGINDDLYKLNPPIKGTNLHMQDIVFNPRRVANGWGGGYAIDFSKPGAQAYVDSVVQLFASWQIDFLKFDGVTPGSDHYDLKIDSRVDVKAWSEALQKCGRPIWLTLSWKLDPKYANYWQQYANAWRITTDVETYGDKLVGWPQVTWRFDAARDWAKNAGVGKGWNDLDSLDVGSGQLDGLTDDERQSMMTLWAIACSPLYTGDDLTKLDDYGVKLLTNDEVIAIDHAGHPATQVIGGQQQVWQSHNDDGSVTVALFNLDNHLATVTAKWPDLGLVGPATVRDLWSHTDLGVSDGSFSAMLAPHASRLVRVVPRAAQK